MAKLVIEVKNLTKRFKNQVVLDKVSLKVYRGEIFGLLGPNGAGKTVLIQTLLGTIEPNEGEIRVFGQELSRNLSQIHAKVNLASAYSQLQGQITPLQNLLTFAGLYGVPEARKKAQKLLRFLELGKYGGKKIRTDKLSSGENARLLLCKALVNDPEILFLDEPTTSLDPKITEKVQDFLLKLHQKRRMTIFYASHNLPEVKKICTRIGFLKKGKLIKVAPVGDLKKLTKLY